MLFHLVEYIFLLKVQLCFWFHYKLHYFFFSPDKLVGYLCCFIGQFVIVVARILALT